MRSVLSLGVLLIFIITFTGPVMAQEAPIPEQIKKCEPLIGQWKNQVEMRESPTDPWAKYSNEWEFSWLLKGHCVQNNGKTSTGRSYVELFGYDPQLNTVIGSGFSTNGDKRSFTSVGWDGRVFNLNAVITSRSKISIIVRCSYTYPSDFKSFTGTCEMLTDGKWWISHKVQGAKVK